MHRSKNTSNMRITSLLFTQDKSYWWLFSILCHTLLLKNFTLFPSHVIIFSRQNNISQTDGRKTHWSRLVTLCASETRPDQQRWALIIRWIKHGQKYENRSYYSQKGRKWLWVLGPEIPSLYFSNISNENQATHFIPCTLNEGAQNMLPATTQWAVCCARSTLERRGTNGKKITQKCSYKMNPLNIFKIR